MSRTPRIGGVNVVGPLRAESGVGEAARAVIAALDAVRIPVIPVLPPEASVSRQGVRFRAVGVTDAAFPVTVLCLTAAETPGFASAVGPGFFRGRHTIGLWWWEVSRFPELLHPAFAHVDEVWAGSSHIAAALTAPGRDRDVPVTHIRVPVRRAPRRRIGRAELGMPEGFVFLTVFGYYSSVARKNPGGAIEAFRRAFPHGSGASLVVKCIDEAAHPDEHAELLAAAATHPDVHVLPGYLRREEMDALIQQADAVVSLHRAEGFGFTPAEAMAQGKPVIATNYSGNLDYMTPENASLIPAALVPIGAHGGPYPSDGEWAEPDLDAAAAAMRRLAGDPDLARRLGERAARDMADRWTAEAAGRVMRDALAPHADGYRWARARLRAAQLRRGRRR